MDVSMLRCTGAGAEGAGKSGDNTLYRFVRGRHGAFVVPVLCFPRWWVGCGCGVEQEGEGQVSGSQITVSSSAPFRDAMRLCCPEATSISLAMIASFCLSSSDSLRICSSSFRMVVPCPKVEAGFEAGSFTSSEGMASC